VKNQDTPPPNSHVSSVLSSGPLSMCAKPMPPSTNGTIACVRSGVK
jgi:hypothetical protein